jgi:adenylate cyclase class IV
VTAPYEAEVRVPVARIDALRSRLAELGAHIREVYAFTDDYYRLESGPSRVEDHGGDTASLRVREYDAERAEVLFARVSLVSEAGLTFKRSALANGKLTLMRGGADECRALVDSLGFVPWLRVRKRRGEIIEIPSVGTVALEDIEHHGWWLEIEVEGADPAQASAALLARLDALRIDRAQASGLPLAALLSAGGAASPAPQPQRRAGLGGRAYFCGAIRGGRQLQTRYARFIDALERAGWNVLTAHVGAADVFHREERVTTGPADIWRRDMAWLADASVVVADVTVPSLGVGIEIATALQLGVPVIALVEAGTSLSALVRGDERIRLIEYGDEDAAVHAMLSAVSDSVV